MFKTFIQVVLVLPLFVTVAHAMPTPGPTKPEISGKLHPASLIPAHLHHQGLLQFLQKRVSQPLINHLVSHTEKVADLAMKSSGAFRVDETPKGVKVKHDKFTENVVKVIDWANVPSAAVLVSILYMDRAQNQLDWLTEDRPLSKLFVSSLLVALKYTNDKKWVIDIHLSQWATKMGPEFRTADELHTVERAFLGSIQSNLKLTEEDLVEIYKKLPPECQSSQPGNPRRQRRSVLIMPEPVHSLPPSVSFWDTLTIRQDEKLSLEGGETRYSHRSQPFSARWSITKVWTRIRSSMPVAFRVAY